MGDLLKKNDVIKPFTINEKFLEQVLEAKWWKDNLPTFKKYKTPKEKLYFKTRV